MIDWTPVYKSLGRYLGKRRRELGLTQSEAASLAGNVSAQFISNIERGVSSIPMYLLVNISEVYRLTRKELTEELSKHFFNELAKELSSLKEK